MAISHVADATAGSRTSGTSHTMTIPAHAVDDIIVIGIASDGGAETLTVSGTDTWLYQPSFNQGTVTGRLAYAIATGTSSYTATISGSSSESAVSECSIFRGVDTSAPWGSTVWTATGSSTTASVSIGTPATDSWIVACDVVDRNRQTAAIATVTASRFTVSGNGSADVSGGMGYDSAPTASESLSCSISPADGWGIGAYELIVAAAGPELKTGTETLDLVASEGSPVIQAHRSTGDLVDLVATAITADLFAQSTRTDVVDLVATDAKIDLLAVFGTNRVDAVDLVVTETATTIDAVLNAADVSDLVFTEGSPVIQANRDTGDVTDLVANDVGLDLFSATSTGDLADLVATEGAPLVQANQAVSDAVSLVATEGVTTISVTLSSVDGVDLSLAEAVVAPVEVFLSRADAADVAAGESTALLVFVDGAADTVNLSIADTGVDLVVIVDTSDVVGLTASEVSDAILVYITSSDTIDVVVGGSGSVVITGGGGGATVAHFFVGVRHGHGHGH
jgi:hypothetical protein